MKIIYKILSFFNLQFALFVLIIGAILYVTGVLDGSRAALLGFCLALIVSVLAGVIFTLKKLLLSDGVKKSKGVQIIAPSDSGREQSDRGGSGNSFDGEGGKGVDEIPRVERGSENAPADAAGFARPEYGQVRIGNDGIGPDSGIAYYNGNINDIYDNGERGDSVHGYSPRQNVNASFRPKIFAVKGHPSYFMAEYTDRYELYKKSSSGLRKIRTDYK